MGNKINIFIFDSHTFPHLGSDLSLNLCSGSRTDLTGLFPQAGLTAQWTESGNQVTDPTAVGAAGSYQLIVSDNKGCSDTAYATVTLINGPDLGSDQSHTLCPWMSVDLGLLYNMNGLHAAYTYNGMPLSAFSAVYDSGTYAIFVTDVNGCTDGALIFISNMECSCFADFSYYAKCIQDPATFELVADSDVVGARWIFDHAALPDQYGNSSSVRLPGKDSMLVTLEASLSCGTIVVKKYVRAQDCSDSCRIYFPDAFTPNDDGLNDHFTWSGECRPTEYLLEIHNRFGQLVFRTSNPYTRWDGTSGNSRSPSGVYVFHAGFRLPYQDKKYSAGKITLLR